MIFISMPEKMTTYISSKDDSLSELGTQIRLFFKLIYLISPSV